MPCRRQSAGTLGSVPRPRGHHSRLRHPCLAESGVHALKRFAAVHGAAASSIPDFVGDGGIACSRRRRQLERFTVSRKRRTALPFVFTQFRTEGCGEVAEPNRYALFPELLFLLTQFRTENRYALFLECS
ncbi:hypothetical protein EH240_00550 [Mesorhizobium tamadayense]|uniref:Uncharacterized protein n=1 Tax=Mesorhizobium tamadayense TaxID=425306 RepID=A0A3P3GA66_9HYPH|nr:hypothetical protein EH240_00550 [Mesorhizobium tamadayense]